MTSSINSLRSTRPFMLSTLAMAMALAAGHGFAATQTYTLNGDFDLGAMTGVNHSAVSDQLQLNVGGTSFPVLWIANAGEDTLSKIDTTQQSSSVPGKEIARYRTWFNAGGYDHGAWSGMAPSRTAVDVHGNAYVADRGFNNFPYVFKILNNTSGMANTSFDGRNGQPVDGTINLSEMMPLVDNNGNGIIDQSEIQDQAIAWVTRVPDGVKTDAGGTVLPQRYDGVARALCIGTDGNLWVGLYNKAEYYKISATDGHTIAGPIATSHPNYGCLIDQNGTLWGANWDRPYLTRIANTGSNTGPYTVSSIPMPNAVYGLALRRDASNNIHVIMGGSSNSYVDYNDGTGNWSKPAAANYATYAVGTDNNGNILVSKQNGGVAKFDPSGSVIWDKGSQVGSSDSRGVIADANNDIWQVHRASNNIAKYAGSDGSSLGVKGVGYEPYTYSDASGTAALSITTKTGNWDVVKDGGAAGTKWGTVSWNATIPSGASVVVEVRVAETQAGLASQTFQTVTSGTQFNLTGRFIEVKITLTANPLNISPVVYDVSIANQVVAICSVDTDGDIDTLDLALISKARGQKPTANDPRDANLDGKIDPADVKVCIPKCTRPNCATQ